MPYAGFHDKRNDGWLTYSEWQGQLGSLREVFTEHEEYSLRELLPRAYYRGHGRERLPEPTIETVVVFFPKSYTVRTELYSVKFQRIVGRPQTERPEIFHTASPTTPSGKPNSFLLIQENNRIIEAIPGGTGRWDAIYTDPIDCMNIALILGGHPSTGDYFYVDVPKYTSRSAGVYINVSST